MAPYILAKISLYSRKASDINSKTKYLYFSPITSTNRYGSYKFYQYSYCCKKFHLQDVKIYVLWLHKLKSIITPLKHMGQVEMFY